MAPLYLHIIKILTRRKRGKVRKIVIFKKANKHRDRGWSIEAMEMLEDHEFTRMFRLNRQAFNDLLQKITLIMPEKDEKKAISSSGSVIKNKVKLAITLRWLAGASYLDLSFGFAVSRSTIFNNDRGILWPTIRAINEAVRLTYPTDIEEIQRISEEFADKTHGIFDNIAGAIDGLVIKTRQPFIDECQGNPVAFRNRKGTFGILALGVADIRGKFLSFSCNWSGSTHDSYAYADSKLYDMFENNFNNLIPEQFYLIGDEAFTNTNRMLSPWAGRNLDAYKDSFNYHLSSCRQCIERAFGMLVKRWGILWRKLTCSFDKWPLVAMVCARLHNICIDFNVPAAPRLIRDIQQEDVMEVILDNERILANHATGDRRRIITRKFEEHGIRRPPVIRS